MSLYSLKKCAPSAERHAVNVDDFIDGALAYSSGSYAQPGSRQLADVVALHVDNGPMKRATFCLNDHAIDALGQLSALTGLSRSRLLRFWIEQARVQVESGMPLNLPQKV